MIGMIGTAGRVTGLATPGANAGRSKVSNSPGPEVPGACLPFDADWRPAAPEPAAGRVSCKLLVSGQDGSGEMSKFFPQAFYFDTFVYTHCKKCR